MVSVIECVLGNVAVALLGEVCLRDKHDIYVMGVEEHFEFMSVLYEAVGFPDGKLQEFSHYVRRLQGGLALIPVGQRYLSLSF
jgi:hypothetical protein